MAINQVLESDNAITASNCQHSVSNGLTWEIRQLMMIQLGVIGMLELCIGRHDNAESVLKNALFKCRNLLASSFHTKCQQMNAE